MKEIQVLTDVRLSPESVDLLLTRQALTVEGGELRLVGAPTESRLPLLVRRVRITFGANADNLAGFVAVASVQNLGLVPFAVTKVAFAFQYGEPRPGQIGGRNGEETGGSYLFIPKDRKSVGPLQPLETREYYLPAHVVDAVRKLVQDLPAENVKVVAYTDKDVVGEAPAREVLPYFDLASPTRSGWVRLTGAANYTMAGLDVESREGVLSALGRLAMTALDQRGGYPGLTRVDENLDLLSVSPDFRVLLRQNPQGGIEVVDIIRAAGRKAERPEEETVGAKA